jgi:hypothetical protein
MPRTPNLRLQALWRERVHRQVDSGLSIAQFCARERLAMSSFYLWKRRLSLIDLADRSPTLATRPAFLPVSVRVVDHADDGPLPIEADLPNGVHLRIPTANPRLACRVVRAVAGARTDTRGSR